VPQSLRRTWIALAIAALAVLVVAVFVGRDFARDVLPACTTSLEAGRFDHVDEASLVPVTLETTEPVPSTSRWLQLRFDQKTDAHAYPEVTQYSDVRIVLNDVGVDGKPCTCGSIPITLSGEAPSDLRLYRVVGTEQYVVKGRHTVSDLRTELRGAFVLEHTHGRHHLQMQPLESYDDQDAGDVRLALTDKGRKEFDDATSSRQLAEASVQQATAAVRQAELNLSYTAVNAPVAGITGRATHSVGTLITTDSAGSLLTTINQLTPIWVRFSLAESDLARIPGGRIGRDSPLEVQVLFSDGTPYAGKGRLNFAATAIDTRLGTQQLRAEFDNPREQLLPGMFVKVSIGAGQRDNVFLVPQAAVIQTEKANLVFVVDGEGKAQARTVQTGDWLGTDWGIVSGLSAGERVIVDNLQKVRPGAPVTEAPPAATGAPAGTPAPAPAAPK